MQELFLIESDVMNLKVSSFSGKLLLLVFFTTFVLASLIVPSTALNRTYEVQQGNTYNFDVISDGRNQGSRPAGFTGTRSFPFTRTGSGFGNFNFSRTGTGFGNGFFGTFGNFYYTNFDIRPSFGQVPTTGTIYSVTLTTLPTNSTEGDFTYNIPGQSSIDVSSYYAYGEPVISSDWAGWKTELTNDITTIKASSGVKSASLSITSDTSSQFSTSIKIDINPPTITNTFTSSGFNFQISNIQLTQQVTYDKATGIRQDFKLTTAITTSSGQRTQSEQIDYTTQSTRVAPVSSSSNNNMLLFLGVLAVIVIPLAGIFVYRAKQKGPSQAQVLKYSEIKQKSLVDDLKLRLQNAELKNQPSGSKGHTTPTSQSTPLGTQSSSPAPQNLSQSTNTITLNSGTNPLSKTKHKAKRR